MHIHPMITVKSVQESAAWYEQALGLERAHGGDEYEQLVRNGRLLLQLHNSEADMNHPPLVEEGEHLGGGLLLWFRVDDFEAQVRRLADAGITPEVAPYLNQYAQHMEVWFRDPDGYRIVVAGPSSHQKWTDE